MSRLAGSAKLLRAMNESAALGYLLDKGALTRNDLRELTGPSKPTTSEVLRRLSEAGAARSPRATSRGPLRTPVDVDNDVTLAAVAERRRGVAGAVDSFALLWFGEGLGLAIDLGGMLLRGASGGAGEIGSMPLGFPASVKPRPDLQNV